MPLRRPVGLVALLALLALTASLLALSPASAQAARNDASSVFLNEIHYDNTGTDVGEFVEVANPTGADLTGWSIVLYNGNGGASYDTRSLSGSAAFTTLTYATNGIQNGSPDGVALVDAAGAVVQFLSYEGSFVAVGGPAGGLTSTDIGVAEAGSEVAGQSLQLTGTGSTYGDFAWTGPMTATSGAANSGQSFVAPGGAAQPSADCEPSLAVTSGTAGSTPVSASDADSRISASEITSAAVSDIALDDFAASTADGTPGSATLSVAETTADGTYAVVIAFSTDDDPAQTATCTVEVVVSDPDAVTLLSDVQGDGARSPLVGDTVNVEAVVTSLITSADVLDGFFLQEQDADADTDPNTSEGVFVFCRANCPGALAAGDLVQVTGVVAEFFDNTQINATAGTIAVVDSGRPLPTAAVVALPAATSTRDAATFQSVEGMRTTISTTLAVSEYFNLARFGEIVLTAGERPYQYTHDNAPSEAGYEAYLADLATRRIILDDDSNDQNDATSGPLDNEPYYYPTPGLSTGNAFRGGDTITGLTGVFEYSFGAWKLRPVAGEDYVFEPTNPRAAAPAEVGGRLKVASFNVLNYFTTIDTTSSNRTGTCGGPGGTLDCRGADSTAELDRQRAKIVAALLGLDADVIGLVEIQNDDGVATADLVDALNAATAPGTYAYIDTGFLGTDAIKQAFVYRLASITPVGDFAVLDAGVDVRFDTMRNRPALAQTFEEVTTGARFTAVVNHFKSKGSPCGAGDDSPLDGSANCDGTRTAAAQALADWLATDPTGSGDPDVLVIGDLNSYRNERPITTLEKAGYTDLLEQFVGEDAYTYVFDGQLGYLDYALANAPLLGQVTGATAWHTNADEVPLLDYNDTVKDAGEASFERKSSALPLYAPDPFRASDHDAVVVGLDLANRAPVADAGGPYTIRVGRDLVLSAADFTDPDRNAELTFAWDLDGDGEFDDGTGPSAVFTKGRPPGRYEAQVRVSDGELTSPDTAVVDVVTPSELKPARTKGRSQPR